MIPIIMIGDDSAIAPIKEIKTYNGDRNAMFNLYKIDWGFKSIGSDV